MTAPTIAVINTGGTISCTGDPLSPMTAAQFADAGRRILDPVVTQLSPGLTLTYVTDLAFPESASHTLDSTNLQPTDWCLIAGYILTHYAEYDGWVVLHGTDSMDFTGTALPFLLSTFSAQGYATAALSRPVIITGSQVPMFYQDPVSKDLALNFNTDAFQNFCGAVAAAQSGIPEVCVYFDSCLMRGSRVLKTNASEFDAFSSPNYPNLGEYGIQLSIAPDTVLPPPVSPAVSLDDPAVRAATLTQLEHIHAHIDSFPVIQFNAFPAWYRFDAPSGTSSGLLAGLIDSCVDSGIKGLILESYGEGNFPSGNPDDPAGGATYQALARAHDQGVTLVDCTQVIRGVVNDSAYASGSWLPAVGALSPADMTPMAALAKLMVLLTAAEHQGWDRRTVATLTQLNLIGEMMSVSRLDSRTNGTLMPGQSLTSLDGGATLLNDPQLGPVLRDASTGKPLWQALGPGSVDLPGRLTMQDDGDLVLRDRFSRVIWSSDTAVPTGAPSTLSLEGSIGEGDLRLIVHDYATGRTTATLYP